MKEITNTISPYLVYVNSIDIQHVVVSSFSRVNGQKPCCMSILSMAPAGVVLRPRALNPYYNHPASLEACGIK